MENPYRGLPAELPDGAPAGASAQPASPPHRSSRIELALGSLIFLAILLPFFALVKSVASGPLSSTTTIVSEDREPLGWLIAGTISAVLGISGGVIAAITGRGVASRIIAGLAIGVGVIVASDLGLLSIATARSLPDPPVATDPAPDCGPDSKPPFYGGDSRWNPCPDDTAAAERLAALLLPALPTGADGARVDADAVEAIVTDPALFQGQSAQTFSYAADFPDGFIVASWVAAPVTCVQYVWDGTAWTSTVQGALIDGGCGVEAQ